MIRRKLLQEVEEHLASPEITIIIGPRQAGKTTIMRMLEEKLKQKGERTLFLNLDIEEDRRYFKSQADLLAKIRLEIGTNKGYVFIDEVQRKEDAGVFLKGLYDMNLPYKFIVSGSGSLELKEKIKESLVGRKRLFELSTLTFEEFVNFKTNYKYEDRLQDFFNVEENKAYELLNEYINYGGYPRVVLSETLKEKLIVMEDIFSSYIDRDIRGLLGVGKVDSFADMIRILAIRAGSLISFSELASTLGISTQTLKNYLWFAEKTFIVTRLTPFFRNRTKEISKSPVFYFYDLGLRNYGAGVFGMISLPEQASFNFENLVFNILREKIRHTGATLHFWRTKDKAEVDFIVRAGEKVVPIEVKYKRIKKPKTGKSMLSFIRKYKPDRAFIINLSLRKSLKIEGVTVNFATIFDLLGMELNCYSASP